MKRFLAVLLLLSVLLLLFGCEQEMDLSFLLSQTDVSQSTVPLTEQDCAQYIIVTEKNHPQFGQLLTYYGKTDGEKGDLYACESGYIYSSDALRVSRALSDSDLELTDALWLLPDDSVKLRKTPSQDSETLALLSGEDTIPVTAVSYTDAVYYAVSHSDVFGYVSADSSHVSEDLAELDFISIMNTYAPIGAQVTLIDDGRITASYAYGFADLESGTEMTDSTAIRCASLSKVFMCICAMKLQDEGAVDIDKNIGSYIGQGDIFSPAASDTDVTLRTILTHTSALTTREGHYDLEALKEHLYSDNAFEPKAKTGITWKYNNFATGVGGTVLELAAKRTLQEYATSTIFPHMDITAAYSAPDLPFGTEHAVLYRQSGEKSRTEEEDLLSVSDIPGENSAFFAGGLHISSRDYAKLLVMLINDGMYNGKRILSKDAVSEMETVQLDTADSLGFSQCLSLRKRDLYGRTLYYHTGNAYGVIAMASYDSETGDGVVLIATGMDTSTADDGIYTICDSLCSKMYTDTLS